MPRGLHVTPLLVVAAVGIGACGGGGGGSSASGDEAALRKLITDVSTKKDPSQCTRAATQRFLEQLQLEKGTKAVKACKQDVAGEAPADSVDIASVKVNGTRATATYTQHGGESDGQTGTVEFVKTGDQWRFDLITGMKIDRPKFDAAMRKSLIAPPNSLSTSVADCSVREIGKLSNAEIESSVVNAKPAALIRPVALCALVDEFKKSKDTAGIASCAARKSIDAMSDSELEESISGGSQTAIEDAIKKALIACGAAGSAGSTSSS